MPGSLRLQLSEEDSDRVREIMRGAPSPTFRERLWDNLPFLHLITLLWLAGLSVWLVLAQRGGSSRALTPPAPPSVATSAAGSGAEACRAVAQTSADGGMTFEQLRTQNEEDILGVDVSKYQGRIDWPRLAAGGVGFAFIKATEGDRAEDPCFADNWTRARSVHVPRGAYHVFSVKSTGKQQADLFLKVLAREGGYGELTPALDLEQSILNGENVAAAQNEITTWLKTVEEQTGRKPLLYGSYALFQGYFRGKDPFQGYPVWLAEYTKGPIHEPSAWPRWDVWQFTPKAKVDGIVPAVDVSRVQVTNALYRMIVPPRPGGQ